MGKTEIISLLFLTIEMTQSISVGVFLILMRLKNREAVSYLGIFLVILGISFLPEMLRYFDDNHQFPALDLLSFGFIFFHTSLFYAYINSLIIHGDKGYNKKLIAFGGIIFISCLSILFLSPEAQSESMAHWYFQSLTFGCIIYVIVIYLLAIVQIFKHNRKLKEQYSNVSRRELTWVAYLLFFAFAFFAVVFPFLVWLEVSNMNIDLITILLNTVWVLGLAYNGLYFQQSKNLFKANSIIVEPIPSAEIKAEKVSIKNTTSKTDILKLFNEINGLVKNEQSFLNPELTIAGVASLVNKHPRLVSQTINSESGQNFNVYINRFRVNYAKELLLSTEYEHISIEGLGKMAGFKSTSAYYTAFKKHLNCTPSQYKKRHLSTISS